MTETTNDRNKLGKECIISTGHMVPAKPLTREAMAEAKDKALAELEAEKAKG